jgi:hypothetical protein
MNCTILKLSLSLSLGVGALFLGGCGKQSEADMLAEAQLCLDKATSSTAQACALKIQALSSAQSYIIRCSADFIEAGFDSPNKLADALNQVSGGGTSGMLSALAFTTKLSNSTNATNASNADQTFEFCKKSEQKGLSMIAMLAKTATQIAGLVDDANLGTIDFAHPETINAGSISTAISDLVNTSDPVLQAQAQETVGSTVQAVYSSTCTAGSQANADICNQISAAAAAAPGGIDLTTSTPAEIGSALLSYWQSLNP